MSKVIDAFEKHYAKDRKAWRKWLEKNHSKLPGVWLIYYKKESGKTRVSYNDAVEEALCFGWIDSTMRPGDADFYMQLFTPRKPKSGWSRLNKERIEKMIAGGLMRPAGREKIEDAKKNGHWEKLDGVESETPTPELEAVFKKNKKAKIFFESLSKWNRKYILYYINGAKLPATKAKRIEEIISAANEGRMADRFLRMKKP